MHVLSIDCGTQSLRAIIFDKNGETLAFKQVIFEPYYSIKIGYAEQDALVFYNALCKGTLYLKENYPDIMDKVKGVTITTQRDGVICVDEKGALLRPAIIWADQRKINKPRKMSLLHESIFRLIGMKSTVDTLSRNCKAHWIQDNEPEIWAKTYKYLQLSAFLNYKLTGLFIDSMASQVGHIPFSYKHFRYEYKHSLKHDIFHIDNKKLCQLIGATKVIGYISESVSELTGIPIGAKVIAAGSDKGCETVGVGCNNTHMVSVSLGSQASIQTTTKKYYETLRFIPPFQSLVPDFYNPEIQIYRGYWMVSWFKKEFALKEVEQAKGLDIVPEEILDRELDKIPPGAEGLVLQPYWGAGVKMQEAKGAIIGFTDGHTRLHIYRAIIEGIGFALYEGMCKIEKRSGKKIRKVMISGGGSKSDVICQITANIFKLPVCRVQTYETSALGAAMAGYIGLEVYSDFNKATESMVHVGKCFYPEEKNVEIYEKIYNDLYTKVYKRLKPLYKVYKDIF